MKETEIHSDAISPVSSCRVGDEQAKLGPAAVLDMDLPCGGCGYLLRGLEVGGRCPECGRQVWESVGFGGRLDEAPSSWLSRLVAAAWIACAARVILAGVLLLMKDSPEITALLAGYWTIVCALSLLLAVPPEDQRFADSGWHRWLLWGVSVAGLALSLLVPQRLWLMVMLAIFGPMSLACEFRIWLDIAWRLPEGASDRLQAVHRTGLLYVWMRRLSWASLGGVCLLPVSGAGALMVLLPVWGLALVLMGLAFIHGLSLAGAIRHCRRAAVTKQAALGVP